MGDGQRAGRSEAVAQLAQALLDELGARVQRAEVPAGGPGVQAGDEAVPKRKREQISIVAADSITKRFRVIAATRGVSHSVLFEQMVRDLPDPLPDSF